MDRQGEPGPDPSGQQEPPRLRHILVLERLLQRPRVYPKGMDKRQVQKGYETLESNLKTRGVVVRIDDKPCKRRS